MRATTTTTAALCFVAAHLLLLVTAAHADTIRGTVAATQAAWDGDVIVSRADVVDQAGVHTRVVQLGGSVDGVGMVYSDLPLPVRIGESVTLDVTADGVVQRVRSRSRALSTGVIAKSAAGPGTAVYGLQRTTAGTTLWRESGCIDLAYDQASIDDDVARVLDQAFGAWVAAVDKARCGGLSITRHMQRGTNAANDGLSTVRVRTTEWCRPATLTSPKICYPPEAAAVTRLVYIDSAGSPNDGRIEEADMELNAVDFNLVLPGQTPADVSKTSLFLRAVATHEAGHLVGLGHDCGTGAEPWPSDESGMGVPSCDTTSSDVTTATMFYAVGELDDGASTLEAADVEGACAIAKTQSCEENLVGGCNAARGSGCGWPMVLLLLGVVQLAAQRRRRRRA